METSSLQMETVAYFCFKGHHLLLGSPLSLSKTVTKCGLDGLTDHYFVRLGLTDAFDSQQSFLGGKGHRLHGVEPSLLQLLHICAADPIALPHSTTSVSNTSQTSH